MFRSSQRNNVIFLLISEQRYPVPSLFVVFSLLRVQIIQKKILQNRTRSSMSMLPPNNILYKLIRSERLSRNLKASNYQLTKRYLCVYGLRCNSRQPRLKKCFKALLGSRGRFHVFGGHETHRALVCAPKSHESLLSSVATAGLGAHLCVRSRFATNTICSSRQGDAHQGPVLSR